MPSKTAAQLVQEAKQRVENLSVDQVAAELDRGDAVLVDLREPGDKNKMVSSLVQSVRRAGC